MFLTPKVECAYLDADSTLRQALEKMEHHRYQALPVIDEEGRYINTLTEGDLLWTIKEEYLLNFKEAEESYIKDIIPHREITPIDCQAGIKDALIRLQDCNFIPVNDDRGYFIGIVTRKKMISYFLNKGKL